MNRKYNMVELFFSFLQFFNKNNLKKHISFPFFNILSLYPKTPKKTTFVLNYKLKINTEFTVIKAINFKELINYQETTI